MLDFYNLSRKELAVNGLCFETQDEAELFAAIIRKELEVRIGEAISEQVGEEATDEFASCETTEDDIVWLERNCPGYGMIVKKVQNEFHREIVQFRDRIPGIVPLAEPVVRYMSIDELGISLRSHNCLKRAGIATVGDLLDYGDISDIRNLGKNSIQEVREKLMGVILSEDTMDNYLQEDTYFEDEELSEDLLLMTEFPLDI